MALPQIGPWTFLDQSLGNAVGNADSVFAVIGPCSADDGSEGNIYTFPAGTQLSDITSRIGYGPAPEAAAWLSAQGVPFYVVPTEADLGTFGSLTPGLSDQPNVAIQGLVGFPGSSVVAQSGNNGNGTVAIASTSKPSALYSEIEVDCTSSAGTPVFQVKLDGVVVATSVNTSPFNIPVASGSPNNTGILLSFSSSGSFVAGDSFIQEASTPNDVYLVQVNAQSSGDVGSFPLFQFNWSLDGGNSTSGNINATPALLPLLTASSDDAANVLLSGAPNSTEPAPNLKINATATGTAGGSPVVTQPATSGTIFVDPSSQPTAAFHSSSGDIYMSVGSGGSSITIKVGGSTGTTTYTGPIPTGAFNIPNATGLTGVIAYFVGPFTASDTASIDVTAPAQVEFYVDGSNYSSALTIPVGNPAAWVASHNYNTVGTAVLNNGNLYGCITAGTSASFGGPSGTGSNITDGGAHWAYLTTPANATPGTATLALTGTILGTTVTTGLSALFPNGSATSYSSSNPDSWSVDFASSIAFVYPIKEADGTFTGVALTFNYGTYSQGAQWNGTATGPLSTQPQFDAAMTTLTANPSLSYSMIHLTGTPQTYAATQSLVDDIETQLDALPNSKLIFLRAVIDGPAQPSSVSGAAPSDAASAFSSVTAARCEVAGSIQQTTSQLTGRTQQRTYGTSLMARLASVPLISNDPGYAALGALPGVTVPTQSQPPSTSNDDASAFDDARISAAYQPVQVQGVYPVRGITLDSPGGQYGLIQRGRVIDKAARIVSQQLFQYLNSSVPTTKTGTIDPSWAKKQASAIGNVLCTTLPVNSNPTAGNAPNANVQFNLTHVIDPTLGGDNKLPVSVTVGAWQYVFSIPVSIGFSA